MARSRKLRHDPDPVEGILILGTAYAERYWDSKRLEAEKELEKSFHQLAFTTRMLRDGALDATEGQIRYATWKIQAALNGITRVEREYEEWKMEQIL